MDDLYNIPMPPSSSSQSNAMEVDTTIASQTATASPASDASLYWAKAQLNLQQLQQSATPTPTVSLLEFAQLTPNSYATAAANYPYYASFASPAYSPSPQFAAPASHSISAANRLASHRRFNLPSSRIPFRANNPMTYTPQQLPSRANNSATYTPPQLPARVSNSAMYTPPRLPSRQPRQLTPESSSSFKSISNTHPLRMTNIPPPSLVIPPISVGKRNKKKKASMFDTPNSVASMSSDDQRQSAKSGGSRMTLPESEEDEQRKQKRAQRFMNDMPMGAEVLGRGSGASSAQRPRYVPPHVAAHCQRTPNSAHKRNLNRMIEKCTLKKRRRIIGTCQKVDKPYFRLTTEADPTLVRPFPVLVQALDRVRELYATNGDYKYANDQLKSIRQDLITQDIRNGFSVSAYEEHVLLAIKHKDREEFNQSQQQLKVLYDNVNAPRRLIFTAYRLLYYVYVESESDATKLLQKYSLEVEASEELSFARKVYHVYTCKNYEALLRLYESGLPVMRQIMDFFIERERDRYFKCILAAYRPTLTVEALGSLLHLSKHTIYDYLEDHGLSLENNVLDIRKCANITIASG